MVSPYETDPPPAPGECAGCAALKRRIDSLERWRFRLAQQARQSFTSEVFTQTGGGELAEAKDGAKWWRRTIVDKVLTALIAVVAFLLAFLVSQLLKKG